MSDVVKQTTEARVSEQAKQYKVEYSCITLSKPFDIAVLEVEALYMREPVALDFDYLDVEEGESAMKGVRLMICGLCCVSSEALDFLPLTDYGKLMSRVKPFLDIAL